MHVDIVDIRVNVILTRWSTPSYLLTPSSRVLIEKLTGFQLVQKFPTFYGTWRYITAFTSAHHLSLSWASSIQSMPPHPTSWRSILTLPSHLRLGLPSGSFLQVSLPKPCIRLSCHPLALHAPPISLFSILSPEQNCVKSTPLYHEKPGCHMTQSPSQPRKHGILSHSQPKFYITLGYDNLRNPVVTQSHVVPMETTCDSLFHIKKTE